MRFSEQQLYSPLADTELLRLSAWCNGGEYYVLIPAADEGQALREAKEHAKLALELAVQTQPPGEVQIQGAPISNRARRQSNRRDE